jgi:hypothetical protein
MLNVSLRRGPPRKIPIPGGPSERLEIRQARQQGSARGSRCSTGFTRKTDTHGYWWSPARAPGGHEPEALWGFWLSVWWLVQRFRPSPTLTADHCVTQPFHHFVACVATWQFLEQKDVASRQPACRSSWPRPAWLGRRRRSVVSHGARWQTPIPGGPGRPAGTHSLRKHFADDFA